MALSTAASPGTSHKALITLAQLHGTGGSALELGLPEGFNENNGPLRRPERVLSSVGQQNHHRQGRISRPSTTI